MELKMLAERRPGRKGRLIATVEPIENELAAGCRDLAQHRHLVSAAAIDHDLDTLGMGEIADGEAEILFFGQHSPCRRQA